MTQDHSELKSDLRTRMRAKLAAQSDRDRREASAAACEQLAGLDAFRHASTVMLYMPLPDEVDVTATAIRCFQSGKNVCVPRVDWARCDMDPVEAASFDDEAMAPDEHGIRTPRDGAPVLPTVIDLVVVPGLAFDPNGNRLGRGGGFYDRFLRRLRRGATTIGLAFDLQIVDVVPADDRDFTVDWVVTDRRATQAGARRAAR